MIISIFNLDNKEQEDINIIFRNFNRKMNLKEISTIKKYINSYNRKDVTISIDDYNTNIEDIFYLMNERKIPYLYVKTENENIKDIIKKLNQEAKVIYESTNNDDSKISLRKEDYLIYKSQNKYIKFAQSEKNRYAIFFESEEDGVHPRNILTIEEYKKICNIIERYKCFLKEYNAIHNLWTIYYLIGKHIDYAFNEDGDPERNNRYHSIKGAILEKKAVCQGYTDLLAFCLESIGIENIIVKGRNKFEKEISHEWNQVKINGNWYNCDITNDAPNIQQNRKTDYFLVSDKEMFLYDIVSKKRKRCDKNFNIERYISKEREDR